MEHSNEIKASQRDVVKYAKTAIAQGQQVEKFFKQPDSSNNKFLFKELMGLFKNIYGAWYSAAQKTVMTTTDDDLKQNLFEFLSQPENAPEKIKDVECIEKVLFTQKLRKYDTGINLPRVESFDYDMRAYDGVSSFEDWLELAIDSNVNFVPFGFDEESKILYLNVDIHNGPKIANELLSIILKDNRQIAIRVATNDKGPLMIFANDFNMQKVVQALDQMYKENPSWFTTEVPLAFVMPINKYAWISDLNSVKTKMTKDFRELSKYVFLAEIYRAIDAYATDYRENTVLELLKNSKSNELKIKDSMRIVTLNAMTKSVNKEIRKCKNLVNKDNYALKMIDFYSEILGEIKLAYDDKGHYINKEVQKIIDNDYKSATISKQHDIKFKNYYTPYSRMSDEDKDSKNDFVRAKEFLDNDFVETALYFDVDYTQQLLTDFSLDNLDERVTLNAIAPYLEKRNISPYCPFLTPETVAQIQKELLEERKNRETTNNKGTVASVIDNKKEDMTEINNTEREASSPKTPVPQDIEELRKFLFSKMAKNKTNRNRLDDDEGISR